MQTKIPTHSLILFTVILVTLFNAVLSFITDIQVVGDTLASYKIAQSWEQGAPFNHIWAPDQNNIGSWSAYEVVWWTPAQYLLPWTISTLSGYPLHVSEWIVAVFSIISFSAGFYLLLRELKFSIPIIHLSLALILTTQAMLFRLHCYDGGTSLMDSIWPWFIYAIVKFRLTAITAVGIILIAWAGFFMKASFLVIVLASALFICVRTIGFPIQNKKLRQLGHTIRTEFKPLYKYGILFSFILLTSYTFFISKGDTPSSVSRDHDSTYPQDYSVIKAFIYPLSAPVDSLIEPVSHIVDNNYLSHSPILGGYIFLMWLSLLAVIFLRMLYVVLMQGEIPLRYRELLLSFSITYTTLFCYFFLRDTAISLEARHFYPLSFVLVPSLISVLKNNSPKIVLRATVILFTMLFALNESSFILYRLHSHENKQFIEDYHYPDEISDSVKVIKDLDREFKSDAVFYITPWNQYLEFAVRHNKTYPLGLGATGIPTFRKTPYFDAEYSVPGRARTLIVVTEAHAQVPPKWFPDYESFDLILSTEQHSFWIGN